MLEKNPSMEHQISRLAQLKRRPRLWRLRTTEKKTLPRAEVRLHPKPHMKYTYAASTATFIVPLGKYSRGLFGPARL